MIALRDQLPLIELGNGFAVAFERDWLIRSLARAARKAGYAQWWLAEHVAQSVTEYLRTQPETNVVPVEVLSQAVRSALEVIGYAEVAQHFEPTRPKVTLSLLDVAREAGSGYELAFFDRLGRIIHELVCQKTCDFELTGLDRCVKLLKARKVWCRADLFLSRKLRKHRRPQGDVERRIRRLGSLTGKFLGHGAHATSPRPPRRACVRLTISARR